MRTPPYHCNLNPIEMVWAEVKGHVAANNRTFKLPVVKNLLVDGVNGVTPEKWSNCVRHVLEEEDRLMQLDHIIDDMEDQLIIDGSDSSSDNDAESSELFTMDSDVEDTPMG